MNGGFGLESVLGDVKIGIRTLPAARGDLVVHTT